MYVAIEIGVGEALDRLTILALKSELIPDPEKARRAGAEASDLWYAVAGALHLSDALLRMEITELRAVNLALWEIEEKIRAVMAGVYDAHEFAALAKQVPILNDRRAVLKRQFDDKYQSEFREVKSYV